MLQQARETQTKGAEAGGYRRASRAGDKGDEKRRREKEVREGRMGKDGGQAGWKVEASS